MGEKILSHVMYVDDEPDMRMLVQITLENAGDIRVTVCDSGFDVVQSAIDNNPQMIILDVMMADMDGPTLLKEIKLHPKLSHIPVVFLTGKTGDKNLETLVKMGAIGVIKKPFDLTALPDQIRALWDTTHG